MKSSSWCMVHFLPVTKFGSQSERQKINKKSSLLFHNFRTLTIRNISNTERRQLEGKGILPVLPLGSFALAPAMFCGDIRCPPPSPHHSSFSFFFFSMLSHCFNSAMHVAGIPHLFVRYIDTYCLPIIV